MKMRVKERSAVFAALLIICSPDGPPAPTTLAAAQVSDAGDVKHGPIEIDLVRIAQANGVPALYANAGGEYTVRPDREVEIHVQIWRSDTVLAVVPRLIIDWGVGGGVDERDRIHCGPCSLNRTYTTEGKYAVTVTMDDRAGGVTSRAFTLKVEDPATPPTATQCLGSGNQDVINRALSQAGSVALLCQGAVFELTESVVMRASGQRIYTEGLPTDARRAVLRLASPALTTAVMMTDRSDAVLSHVIIDGNRPGLGYYGIGGALVNAGGVSRGQTIRFVKIQEPRGWTSLHLIEGNASGACNRAVVEDNEIGPAGNSDGTWADGISLACRDSTVRRNQIVDATDGGIVVFGAPGSVVEQNTVRARTRTLLGGINLVDYQPYQGDFSGTIVRNNLIEAASAPIHIAMAMGVRPWVCLADGVGDNEFLLYGATVTGNTLGGALMRYGLAVDGVRNWVVTDNVDVAAHTGTPTQSCRGRHPASPRGMQFHGARSFGLFQPDFAEAQLESALWAMGPPPRVLAVAYQGVGRAQLNSPSYRSSVAIDLR
jgi:hypothetical protein